MKRSLARQVMACVALLACGAAYAVQLDGNIAVTLDADGGSGIDADLGITPTEHLSFNLGAGHATGPDAAGNLSGTTLNGGASLYSERFGASLDYDRFDDPTNYRAETLGARGWFEVGDVRVSLLLRRRDMGVTLRLDLPRRTLSREMDFSAFGTGVQVSYTNDSLSAYAMVLGYDYDEDFERFLDLPDSPIAERRPRIEALYGSFILQAQGAIKQQAAVGCEYSFGRHSLSLDLTRFDDAVTNTSSTTFGLTWRYLHSAHQDWSVTTGMIDSAIVSDIAFVSVALGLHN